MPLEASEIENLKAWVLEFIVSLRKLVSKPTIRKNVEHKLLDLIEGRIKISVWKVEWNKGVFGVEIDLFKEEWIDTISVDEWTYEDWQYPEDLSDKEYWDYNASELFRLRHGTKTVYPFEDSGPSTDYNDPDFTMRFVNSILGKDPTEKARDYITTHTRVILERRISTPQIIAKMRRICLSNDVKDELTTKLGNFSDLSEEDKCRVISKFFYLIGFEVFPIELLKKEERFKEWNNKPHVDVVAYYYNTIYLVEESKDFSKTRFYKFFSSTLEVLHFEKIIWDFKNHSTIYFIVLGTLSAGIEIPDSLKVINIKLTDFKTYFDNILNQDPELPQFSKSLTEIYKKLYLNQ